MSGSGLREMPVNATLADCARLWTTLRNEYIPALRIEWRIEEIQERGAYLTVEVVDDSAETLDGSPLVNIWATREFRSGLYLISYGQLFELLISAYAGIDQFFRLGDAFAPTRRRK
jgi:hypothetical protein